MDINFIFPILIKTTVIILGVIYVLYSIVLSRQVKIMTKTLEDSFNPIIILVSSIQTTVALILLIFAIFLT